MYLFIYLFSHLFGGGVLHWDLQMWFPCINQMMHIWLIIIDLFLCYGTISKIFKKVMYDRKIDFLEAFTILNISQFGLKDVFHIPGFNDPM